MFKARGPAARLARVEELYGSGNKTQALGRAERLLRPGVRLRKVHFGDRSRARLYAGVIHSDLSATTWAKAKQLRASGDRKGFRTMARKAVEHRNKARRHFARLLDTEPSFQPPDQMPAHVMRDMQASYSNPSRYLVPRAKRGKAGSRLATIARGLGRTAAKVRSKASNLRAFVTGNTGQNAARVARSVVQIDPGTGGSGSGFVYRSVTEPKKRLIMTNQHVVSGLREGDTVAIGFANGARPILARLRGSSAFADVAVLEPLDKLPRGVKPLKLRKRPMTQGNAVAVIGHPYGGSGDGVQPSVSTGVVSQARRGDYLVTDANSAQGNSGGPVVDRRGRVVGMLSAGMDNLLAQAHGSDYGLVQTTATINKVLKRAERGTVYHATTGISVGKLQVAEGYYRNRGTGSPVIRDLKVDSPAHRAGLKVGDVIVGLQATSSGGKMLRNPTPGALFRAELALRPNERVTYEVLRDGQRHRIRTVAKDYGRLWNKAWVVADGGAKQLPLFE